VSVTAEPSSVLHRNRDFALLQAGQLLSQAGTQVASIAYPLLVLSTTGSAAKAGLVGFARILPTAIFALPAGVVADRWNRKRVMVVSDVLRLVAVAAFAAALFVDGVAFWVIPLVAFLEGAGGPFFNAAQSGAMRSVVPHEQLPAAMNVVTGRQAVVSLGGPPLGGALFTIGHALPFAFDAVSYAFSTLSLLAMRTPFEEARESQATTLRSQVAEGVRFLWSHPFLRAATLVFAPVNFIGVGLSFSLVVIAKDHGLSGGLVGVLVASFGVGILVGSFVSPFVRRVLPPRAVLLLETWMWPVSLAFVVWPNPWVLAVALLPAGLAIPSTDSVVFGHQLAITPDRLVGRVSSAFTSLVAVLAPLGPLLAGLMLGTFSERVAVGLLASGTLVVAIAATSSRALRDEPVADATARAGGA
jgi:MFS family permease